MLLGKQQASASVKLCFSQSPLILSWRLHLSDEEDGSLHTLEKSANGGGVKTWGPLASSEPRALSLDYEESQCNFAVFLSLPPSLCPSLPVFLPSPLCRVFLPVSIHFLI